MQRGDEARPHERGLPAPGWTDDADAARSIEPIEQVVHLLVAAVKEVRVPLREKTQPQEGRFGGDRAHAGRLEPDAPDCRDHPSRISFRKETSDASSGTG